MIKYYFAVGQPIAMRKGASLYYLTQDHLGGTALVTDASGAMVSRIRYFPYGGVRTIEGTNPPPTDKLFTGQQRETANGVYHYKARLYNADVGRMPQADTMVPGARNPQAYNRYSYVVNNPINFIDPTGHYCRGGGDLVPAGGQAYKQAYWTAWVQGCDGAASITILATLLKSYSTTSSFSLENILPLLPISFAGKLCTGLDECYTTRRLVTVSNGIYALTFCAIIVGYQSGCAAGGYFVGIFPTWGPFIVYLGALRWPP